MRVRNRLESRTCRVLLSTILVLAAARSGAVSALTIDFDYRYDTRGFFTDSVSGAPLVERRAVLEHAASFYAGFADQLTSIDSADGGTWSVSFTHPSFGGPPVTLRNEVIAANTLKVFVGGSPSAPGVLGFAGSGYALTASGSDEFVATVHGRGQSGALAAMPSDVGPWGGTIWFNATPDWYFGIEPSGLSRGHPDFLTTAIHELGHILGIGAADSWIALHDNGAFTGAQSTTRFGGRVPLDALGAHFDEGVMSDYLGQVQETLMDPSTAAGLREYPTALDYAALADIGWQTSPVPSPPAVWGFSVALLSLCARRRRPHEQDDQESAIKLERIPCANYL